MLRSRISPVVSNSVGLEFRALRDDANDPNTAGTPNSCTQLWVMGNLHCTEEPSVHHQFRCYRQHITPSLQGTD